MHRRCPPFELFSTRPRSKNNIEHEPQNPTTHLLKIIWLLILETVREESPILGLAQSATSALFNTRLLGSSVDFVDSPLWSVVEEPEWVQKVGPKKGIALDQTGYGVIPNLPLHIPQL